MRCCVSFTRRAAAATDAVMKSHAAVQALILILYCCLYVRDREL